MVAYVSAILAIGDARAQGLIARRRWVTLLQGVGLAGFLVLVARSSHLLATRPDLPLLSLALISVGGFGLMLVSVLTVAESARTSVPHLLRWSAPLPLTGLQVRSVLVASGLLRALLFTVAFLAAAAVGSCWGAPAPQAAAAAVGVVVLPVLPTACALRLGRRGARRLAPALMLLPLFVVVLGALGDLHSPAGVLSSLCEVLSTPARVVLSRADGGSALVLLVAWLALSVWTLLTLHLEAGGDPAARRGRLMSLVAVQQRGPRRLTFDLAAHRVRGVDFLVGQLFTVMACVLVVCIAQTVHGAMLLGFFGPLIAVPAVACAYGQVMTASELSGGAVAWLAASPVPPRAVVLAATNLAGVVAMFAALVVAAVAGSLEAASAGALRGGCLAAAVVTGSAGVWSILRWGSQLRGVKRLVAMWCTSAFGVVHAAVAFVVLQVHPQGVLYLSLVDVLVVCLPLVLATRKVARHD